MNAPAEQTKEQTTESVFTVERLIKAGRAMASLLDDESRLIDGMQIDEVSELQERKMKLTAILERYKSYFAKHPELALAMTAEEKSSLQTVSDDFQKALKQNHEKLLVARAVNKSVVNYVTRSIVKKKSNYIYDTHGAMYNTFCAPISMTLNKMV